MDENEINQALVKKLYNDELILKETSEDLISENEIRLQLISRVKELLEKDFNRFVNSLYRMDINEKKVADILFSKEKALIPERIADIIIERQVQRIKTQILYRDGKL